MSVQPAATSRQWRPPDVFVTRTALKQWRQLIVAGVVPADAVLEDAVVATLPRPGAARPERPAVRANGARGVVLGSSWVAWFEKRRGPGGGRYWSIVSVEARRPRR